MGFQSNGKISLDICFVIFNSVYFLFSESNDDVFFVLESLFFLIVHKIHNLCFNFLMIGELKDKFSLYFV